jgi:hypothetical protein
LLTFVAEVTAQGTKGLLEEQNFGPSPAFADEQGG